MFYITLLTSKLIVLLIKLLKLGSGYTWPGHIALRICPNIFKMYQQHYYLKYILVSGTNGKTTTVKLISHILKSVGKQVMSNTSGANLLNGLASSLLRSTSVRGAFNYEYAVFEVDEFNLPLLTKLVTPKIIVLLNLSRDQLDRYGELDLIVERWAEMLATAGNSTSLILDSTQDKFAHFPNVFLGPVFYFDADKEVLKQSPLVGEFNAKNLNAAVAVSNVLGIGNYQVLKALADFELAYGRGEVVDYMGRLFQIFLAKNPTSFNNNLDLLLEKDITTDSLLFILNDEVRDGRDISWIYDINAEKLRKACEGKTVYVSGTRYLEMSTRLTYAGVNVLPNNIFNFLKTAVKAVGLAENNHIMVLPNYSAMLEFRQIVLGRKIL